MLRSMLEKAGTGRTTKQEVRAAMQYRRHIEARSNHINQAEYAHNQTSHRNAVLITGRH